MEMVKIVKSDRRNGRARLAIELDPESRVEKSHKHEVNINTIMAKARKGIPIPVSRGGGMYGDFTGAMDYHSTLQRIDEAMDMFAALPASIRSRFQNEPGQLIEFLSNPENEDKAIELGLIPDRREVVSDQDIEAPGGAEEVEMPAEGAIST